MGESCPLVPLPSSYRMLITDTRPRQPGSALPQLHGSQCLSWQWSVINTPQSSTATPIQRQLLLRSGLTTTLPASLYFLSYSNSATGFYDQTYSEKPNCKQFRPASGSAPSAFCSATVGYSEMSSHIFQDSVQCLFRTKPHGRLQIGCDGVVFFPLLSFRVALGSRVK